MKQQDQERRRYELGGGHLEVIVHQSSYPVDDLCHFALRNNPNRKLLVVSKVAGRHIPVRPSSAWNAFSTLAREIPRQLPGPILFVGLAESAIGLAHSVYEAYRRRTARRDLLFIHSSRHKLDTPVAVYFEEEHSHATQEYLYLPQSVHHQSLYSRARTAVIIDDELTTGRTIQNLARSLLNTMPRLEQIIVANLTDWRTQTYVDNFAQGMPVPTEVVSLLHGELIFSGGPEVTKMPPLQGNNQYKDQLVSHVHGRKGVRKLTIGDHQAYELLALAEGRTLILATEEFAFAPFQLATRLEELGADVVYQSTTRTPIIVGHGAIQSALQFTDNYGDGIHNFVYNVQPGMYDSVIICHETPAASIDARLVQALNATTVRLI